MQHFTRKQEQLRQQRLNELFDYTNDKRYAFWNEGDTCNITEQNLCKARLVYTVDEFEQVWDSFENAYKSLIALPKEQQVEQLSTILVGIDSENTGLSYYYDEIIGIGLCIPKSVHVHRQCTTYRKDYWLPNIDEEFDIYFIVCHPDKNGYWEAMWILLRELVETYSEYTTWVLHNAKYDMHFLNHHLGIELVNIEDTLAMSYVLSEEEKSIDSLAPKYLSRFPHTLKRYLGKDNITPADMMSIPLDWLGDYCGEDCIEGVLLYYVLRQKLEKENCINGGTLWDLYCKCDRDVIAPLVWMEQTGVLVDWHRLKTKAGQTIELEQELIFQDAAIEVGLTLDEAKKILPSPKQLSKLLYEELQLPTDGIKQGKNGQYSTDETSLNINKDKHPLIPLLLELRKNAKLKGTYVDGLVKRARNETIHTSFNNCYTDTGRLSSSDPNLQNLPNPSKSKSPVVKAIRQCFIPRPGKVLVRADYSQFELRILAHFSQDPYLLECYRTGQDVHALVTMVLFELDSYDENNPDHKMKRTLCKTLNFGLIYGMTAHKLHTMSQQYGLPYSFAECEQIVEKYWIKFPGVAQFMAQLKLKVIDRGYTETILGRRRYFNFVNEKLQNQRGKVKEYSVEYLKWLEDKQFFRVPQDAKSLREAGNAPVQGSNADAIRIAMRSCYNEWYGTDTIVLLNVHDELVLETPVGTHEEVVPKLQHFMESAMPLSVPVVVEPKVGLNWGDC